MADDFDATGKLASAFDTLLGDERRLAARHNGEPNRLIAGEA